ncbi:MAG: response regulator [candidate division Zixibacteria bacterium]
MQGKKIVIAEASSTIKSVADSLLRQHGYDVVCTSDGLQAWEVIQAERPDLALIGLNLSGVPGLELCKQMSGDQVARGIPALLIVGGNDNVSKEELMTSGARGHLKKPFSPKDLLEAVTRLIGPGENTTVQQVNGGRNTTKTSYKAEVFSTTGNIKEDSDQIHHVNWSDINETSDVSQPQKVASLNTSSDEHELLIEDDQFGLVSGNVQGGPSEKPATQAPADEDYDWFIGEMKKEVEGGSDNTLDKKEDPSTANPAPAPEKGIRFDDLDGGSGLVLHENANIPNQRPEIHKATPQAHSSLTDSDLERIADRVAQKLADSLISKISRQAIIDAIKASLKSS